MTNTHSNTPPLTRDVTQTIWNRGIINYLVLPSLVQVDTFQKTLSFLIIPHNNLASYWFTQLILFCDWSKPQEHF